MGTKGKRVLITSRVVEQSPAALARLIDRGCRILDNPDGGRIDREGLARRLAEADALIAGTQPIDGATLERSSHLRVIVKAGAGVDNIDVDAARRRGIRVASTSGANAEAVADYALGLLLAVARRIPAADQSVRAGQWQRFVGVDLHRKTLGILGLGHVGRAVARRARGFEMRVLAYDVQYDEAFLKASGVEAVPAEVVFAESDFVSLHLPLLPSTHHFLNRERLAMMKPGAIVVNTARGSLVDEQALCDALTEGRLAGAGLDVFEHEPPGDTPLRALPTVVLSPHNASYSKESMQQVAMAAVDLALELLEADQERPSG